MSNPNISNRIRNKQQNSRDLNSLKFEKTMTTLELWQAHFKALSAANSKEDYGQAVVDLKAQSKVIAQATVSNLT